MISIMIVALISTRTPALGVVVALIAGMIFQIYFGILNEGKVGMTFGNEFYGWKMHGLHVAGVNFALLMLIMLFFRILMPQPIPFEQKYSGDVNVTPWKLAKRVGLGITLAVVAIYWSLWSRFGLTPGKQVAAEYQARYPESSQAE